MNFYSQNTFVICSPIARFTIKKPGELLFMNHSTLQVLAINLVQELLQKRPFFYKQKQIHALRSFEAALRTGMLSNHDIIQKAIAVKHEIHRLGLFGIPGLGCGFYTKPLMLFVQSATRLDENLSEDTIKVNAVRQLAILAANDIKHKQNMFTHRTRREAIDRLLKVVYAPINSNEQIIKVVKREMLYVRTEGFFGIRGVKGSYFLERLRFFLKQAKALKNPTGENSTPASSKSSPPRIKAASSFVVLQQRLAMPMENPKTKQFEAMDIKRKKLEDEITETLHKHAYNTPLCAKWVFRLNRVTNGVWPINSDLFFKTYHDAICQFDKAHPEQALQQKIQSYVLIITNKDYVEFQRAKLIEKMKTSRPLTPPPVNKETIPPSKSNLLGNAISVSHLQNEEDKVYKLGMREDILRFK